MRKLLLVTMISASLTLADTEPSAFAGTYHLTRTNVETGEEFTEELRVYDYDDHLQLECIQGGEEGEGGYLIELWGIEYSDWMAVCDTINDGMIGLYRRDGEGLTGAELYISDTTFFSVKSEAAQALELRSQWARGLYSTSGTRYSDLQSFEGEMMLTGTDSMWQAIDVLSDTFQVTGYGLSAENGVAMLFKQDDRLTVFKAYTITGGNLEGGWMSIFRDWEDELHISVGYEELTVQKIYR